MVYRVVSLLEGKVDQVQSIAQNVRRSIASVPVIRLVWATFHGLGAHDATHMAAGVAYYAVLSIFPLMLGLTAIFSLFLQYETVHNGLVSFFYTYLPASTDILNTNLEGISRLRGVLGVISFVGLFWSGTAMFTAIGRAIDRAWGVTEKRPFYVTILRNVAIVAVVGVLFGMSLVVTSTLQLVKAANVADFRLLVLLDSEVISRGIRIFMILISMGLFLIMYRILPNTRTDWRHIWPGALLATVLFEGAKSLFVLYLDRFGNYQAIYGSVGSVIALLVWIYISALVVILGAEFSSQCSKMGKSMG
jgi:membrane protein